MSDPFQVIADAAKTLLLAQAAVTFPDVVVGGAHFTSVTEWDYSILDRGVKHALIFVPSRFANLGDPGARQAWRTWDLEFDLYVRYDKNKLTDLTDFVTTRGIVIGVFDLYPHLNYTPGITRSKLSAEDEVRDVIKKADEGANPQPAFATQRMRLSVDYRYGLSRGEYV